MTSASDYHKVDDDSDEGKRLEEGMVAPVAPELPEFTDGFWTALASASVLAIIIIWLLLRKGPEDL